MPSEADENKYFCDKLRRLYHLKTDEEKKILLAVLENEYDGWIIDKKKNMILGLYIRDRRKLPAGYKANGLESDIKEYGPFVNSLLFWTIETDKSFEIFKLVDWRRRKNIILFYYPG